MTNKARKQLAVLVMTKCAAHNIPLEKQAGILSLLKKLIPKGIGESVQKGLNGIAGAGKKAILPAAAGGVGLGVGYGTGHGVGDSAGYGRGSAEGGVNATRNLFKGLMDLQQQGASSEADISSLMPKEGSVMSHTEQRQLRIKVAGHILNLKTIEAEMKTYNLHALQKSAAVGANRKDRVKYAALVRQQELEKQALIGGIMRGLGKGLGLGAKALWGGAKLGARGAGAAAKGTANIAASGARAAAPHLNNAAKLTGRGMRAGATGAANAIKANPLQGAAATAALGAGGMAAAPWLGRQASNAVQGVGNAANNAYQSVAQPVQSAGKSVGDFFGNLQGAGQDIMSGFGDAGQRFGQDEQAATPPPENPLSPRQVSTRVPLYPHRGRVHPRGTL